jgi:methyl-accepting chemotaxis protein
MKNANHELSQDIKTISEKARKIEADTKEDIATLKAAKETAEAVLAELNTMGRLSDSQKDRLANMSVNIEKISKNANETADSMDSATDSIDKATEVGQSSDEAFRAIDDIMKKYGL